MFRDGPIVTVYVPSHNYGPYLRQAVESVRTQLYPNWELLIVDEGSTDDTWAIASELTRLDPERIRCIRHDAPLGLQKVANKVLALARGKYLMRLDADDWLDESALLLLTAKLESDSRLGLAYGNYFYVRADGEVIGIERRRRFGEEDLAGHLPPHGAGTLVRTRALKALGGYSEDINAQDGWELWIKLLSRYRAASIEAPVFYYRQHEASLSQDGKRLLEARSRIKSRARQIGDGGYRPSVLAVIPVKESYPGFPGVPYRSLNGQSLLQRALSSALQARNVTRVAVTSESRDVLDYARGLDLLGRGESLLLIERPPELGDAHMHLKQVLAHACIQYREQRQADPDIVLFLSLHAPLRTAGHIDDAVDTLCLHGCDSVVSVCAEREPMFVHGRNGFDLLNPGRFDGLSYERESLFRFNGSVIAAWAEGVREGDLFGQSIGHIEMDRSESHQVKAADDLAHLEMLLSDRPEGTHGRVEHDDID